MDNCHSVAAVAPKDFNLSSNHMHRYQSQLFFKHGRGHRRQRQGVAAAPAGFRWGPTVFLALAAAFSLPGATARAQTPPADKPGVAAVVGGQTITNDELEKAIAAKLAQLEEETFKLKSQQLDLMITRQLLAREAAKRGITVKQLIEAEITSKAGPVSDGDVEALYQQNRARLSGSEAEARERIRSYLESQKYILRRDAFLQRLREANNVEVYLKPPPIRRAEVDIDGAPVRGAATAPVTIVEFSDFHCPFCRQVQPTLTRVLSRYGDKVKLVFRHYPIDSLHPGARAASEAAQCAADQGKFWQFHDRLFAGGADSTPAALKRVAVESGLAEAAYAECLSSGKNKPVVEKDVEQGNALGLTGTPAFYINGRLLSGAEPLEEFVRVIDEELRRGGGKP
jgi:protein-disulfide isomerase